MDIFNALTMIGGLCLFLFGMNVMGQALERRAGGKMRYLLGKMTTRRSAGFLTGCGVTAVIQSSSATTVMVVGFVNSGLMTLAQAINVIMGANVGTTITGWILSLSGVDSGNVWVRLLKPSSFVPMLALVGIILFMAGKGKRKDTGMILLGFATLMFGMETMSSAVSGLADVPQFRELFILFKSPLLGVLAGALLTAVIQSSSASVGILQALAATGQVSYGAAVPIIMGDSIGTCVTALLSSVGANKEAKRAAMAHLCFNLIGAGVWLTVFSIVRSVMSPAILDAPASLLGIAIVNTLFKVLSTAVLLPMSGLLERFVRKLVPDGKSGDGITELDERLLSTPPLALERCRSVAIEMAKCSVDALKLSIGTLGGYNRQTAEEVRKIEERSDHIEDDLSTYLVKLSTRQISAFDSEEITQLLKIIGDYERIADHSVNILESAEEMRDKGLLLTSDARHELTTYTAAVSEILDLSLAAFINSDTHTAYSVEPLEEVIDRLKEKLRTRHILRMKEGRCSIEAGFMWSDLLSNLERVSDHCSNIAGSVIDASRHTLNIHETLRTSRQSGESFDSAFNEFAEKYSLGAQ